MSELMVIALLKQESVIGRDNSAMFEMEVAALMQCINEEEKVRRSQWFEYFKGKGKTILHQGEGKSGLSV